ncbi:MAG: TonB-dependent receptor family protein [Chitinophagaceae bacterium]|nr:TonB-dependent receptor family protein [Chitinophagaceae bacterium]
MRLLLVAILTAFLSFHNAIAQSPSPSSPPLALIKGAITDSLEKKDLSNGSVILLQKSDSIIVRHIRTDKIGHFELKDIRPGRYLLLVTYPSYADYADELEIKDSLPHVLHPISMVLKSKLLEEVVVNGSKGAIRMKGDTVEFKADSFHTQAGATVEDLLKKLPGIQVDSKGKITAQGQTVQKVLVDGEEFFGDDPTLVTQNLRADMVDKVQLYDKKSDQAAFTGIDDGERNKTINLKLKDNKKNGYFGKLSAGEATDGFYDYQAMFNYFRKKMKFAAYGIFSNTGKTGLDWHERDNYGQSNAGNIDYDETTGSYTWTGLNNDFDSWSGRYEGQGLPSVKTGGVHYNNKWDDERQSINGNYKVMQLDVRNTSTTNSENILPDSFYFNNQTKHAVDHILRHSLDGSYEMKFDSTSSLKIMATGGTDHKTTYSDFTSEALDKDSVASNRNTRTLSTVGDSRVFNSNLLWRKKLPKKGRTFSFNLRENYTNNVSNGILNSSTQFFGHGTPPHDSVIDQHKDFRTENILFDGKITYTEPLSKTSYLIANYGLSVNNNHSNRNSYNKAADGKYSTLDSLYSNDYQFNILTHAGGLAYSLVNKKWRVNAGTNVGFTRYDQRDIHADTATQRRFTNWYPNANLVYSFTSQRRLALRYNGYMSQPTLNQIQPIRTNDDPLNIYIGNPGLKPQFNNRIGLNFNDYKVLTDRGIWIDVSYSFTDNAISSDILDTLGKRTNRAINVDGTNSYSGYLGYNFKWKKPELNFYIFSNFNKSTNVSVINHVQNTTNSGSYTLGGRVYKSKDKKYEASIEPSATYTDSRSSVNLQQPVRYWTWSIQPAVDLYLPLKFQVHADAQINLREKTDAFRNNLNNTLLNAWLGKKFLKGDALLVKVSGNDLLNQNIGFNRSANSNFITQTTFTNIKRFYMLSVVWNFTKAGTPAPNQ